MPRYFTLIVWEPRTGADAPGAWFDTFGSYSRAEVEQEQRDERHRHARGQTAIISHDDSAEAMITARHNLPPPRDVLRAELKALREERAAAKPGA